MPSDTTTASGEIVLHFPSPPWRWRVRRHFRALARPRMVALLFGVAVLPTLLDMALSPGEGLPTFWLALGAGTVLLFVVASALSAVVRGLPATTLAFSTQGVRQEIGGTIREHSWDWVIDFTEDAEELAIVVPPPPMRSFRLAPSEPQTFILPRKHAGAADLAELRALVEQKLRGRRARRA